jgi:DNA-directed RNA polymerase sigma subunit (sigma70/sigma32)
MCNVRLLVELLKRKNLHYQTFHDLFSNYYTIMRNAIDKFDYAKNFKFSSYLTRAVKKTSIAFWRKESLRRMPYINDLCKDGLYDPEDNHIKETSIEAAERHDNIELLFRWAALTPEEKSITIRNLGLFGDVETLDSMCSEFKNSTKQNIHHYKSKAINKLRRLFSVYPALFERFLSNSGM